MLILMNIIDINPKVCQSRLMLKLNLMNSNSFISQGGHYSMDVQLCSLFLAVIVMSYFIGSRTIKIFPKWRLLSGSQQQVVTLRLLRHYVSLEYRHLTNCIDKSLVGPICCSMDHLGKKVEMVSLGSPLMIIIFSMLPQNCLANI